VRLFSLAMSFLFISTAGGAVGHQMAATSAESTPVPSSMPRAPLTPSPVPTATPTPVGTLSICSDTNASNLLTYMVPEKQTGTPQPPILQPNDVYDLLNARIKACGVEIWAAPAFAHLSVKVAQGFAYQRAPICYDPDKPAPDVATKQKTLQAVFKLFDQLENCISYVSALQAVVPPTITFKALRPTIYVIVNSPAVNGGQSSAGSGGGGGGGAKGGGSAKGGASGASSAGGGASTASSAGGGTLTASSAGSGGGGGSSASGAGGGSSSAGGGGGSGSAVSSTGTGATDNPGTLMVYDIAIRLGNTAPDVVVIPASAWALADFNNQCLADPPSADGDRGTIGAISVEEATVTNGGSFGLIGVNGWTRVKYSVSLFACDANSFPSKRVWHGFAEGHNFRNGFSMLPISTYLTYISTKWTPATSSTNTVNTAATLAAINYLLPSTSGITIGDTSATMTVPRAYDDAANDLFKKLKEAGSEARNYTPFCSSAEAKLEAARLLKETLCKQLSEPNGT